MNIFYLEELENIEWDEIFLELLQENTKKGLFARLKATCCKASSKEASLVRRMWRCLFCFSWVARIRKSASMTPAAKAK